MTNVDIINKNETELLLDNIKDSPTNTKEELIIKNEDEIAPEPIYWQDVAEYKKLFDKFGAQKVSKELNAAETVRLLLKQNDYAEDPFYIIDLSRVVRQFLQWKRLLPRVHPFFAIKCNPSPCLIQLIGALGGNFDCASKKEIDMVISNANKLLDEEAEFDTTNRIIFANPCKQLSNIKHASSVGVELTTADNEYELRKIAQHWPKAKVVIRIKTDDSHSVCQFSTKFGASVEKGDVKRLIEVGKELGLDLHGVSFHVGSGCKSVQSFVDAIKNARRVFDMAADFGYKMKFLDIGGGFPGVNCIGFPTFTEIAEAISPALDKYFDDSVQVISEPGRYFACASHTLVCNIFAKRKCVKTENGKTSDTISPDFMYYINDGMYGSFNCLFFDHAEVAIRHLPKEEDSFVDPELKLSTIYGPTCDSIDVIKKNTPLPEMQVGDYLYFPSFGAYTCAAGSDFNGFKTDSTHFIWTN